MEFQTYADASMEGLRLQTEAHDKTWHLSEAPTWNVDQDQGIISWTFDNGTFVTAPVQIVGTYNLADNSFLWAWDHPSVLEPLQKHAKLTKQFGQEHKIELLTTQKVTVTEMQAWELTAVTDRLAEANGGYRGDAGGTLIFMTFDKITIQRSSNSAS